MELKVWETLKEAIRAYTGLSPTTFFTVVASGILTYYLLSVLFGSDHQTCTSSTSSELEPLPPPVQLGGITEQDLRLFDGSDPKKPLLMAIKSQIYDVSQSRVFYGPGGPYALFAGRDASRALAKMSFEEKDLTSDISGLGVFELEALQDWEYKFMSKYMKVGTVKKTVRVGEGTTDGDSSQTADVEMSEHTEAIEGEASRPVEVSPKATEAGEVEGAMPVKGHAETTDLDKDYTGSISITDVNKKD